jgi:hypothetical protein
MNGKGDDKNNDRRALEATLRSVLSATGGEAKVRELYQNLKAEEAAGFLAVSVSKLRHLTCRGEIASVKTGRSGVAYRMLDLIAWSDARRRSGSQ